MKKLQFARLCIFLIGIVLLFPVSGICASLNFKEPQRFQAYSKLPIEIIIQLKGRVDLDTLEVTLNNKDITDLFDVLDGNTLVGSIGLHDGLVANIGEQLGGNVIRAEIRDKKGNRVSQRRYFFTKDLNIPNSNYDGAYVGQATLPSANFDMRMVVDGYEVHFYAIWMGHEYESDAGTIDENGNISIEFEDGGPFGIVNIFGTLTGEYMSGEFEIASMVGTWEALKTEDFEFGDFDAFPWITDTHVGWTVTDTEPANGFFAAQAPELYDNESASLEITRECMEGQIRFARKVDSEANFDFLYFYIDDELKGAWSGNIGYTQSACSGYTPSGWNGYTPSGWGGYTPSGWQGITSTGCDAMSWCTGYTGSSCVGYTVTSGSHTFRWIYEKDGSVSNGSDSAWIDNVQFPRMPE